MLVWWASIVSAGIPEFQIVTLKKQSPSSGITSVIPELKKQGQEDCSRFESSLSMQQVSGQLGSSIKTDSKEKKIG